MFARRPTNAARPGGRALRGCGCVRVPHLFVGATLVVARRPPLAKSRSLCYFKGGAAGQQRSALHMGGSFLSPDPRKGGLPMMVTYSDLIQIGILIVGIIGLFLAYKRK